MHKLADTVQAAVAIPLLHIADATAEAIAARGLPAARRCWRPASPWSSAFYDGRLRDRHGLDRSCPTRPGASMVHGIIYEELCRGVVRAEVEGALPRRDRPAAAGTVPTGVILGCTEIGMLIGQDDLDLPVFDTTRLHAEAAMDFATAAAP